jgi:hypothetical protein
MNNSNKTLTKNQQREAKMTNKITIYTCTNCEAKQKTTYIRAMMQAGFDLRHLACRCCGQQELVEKNKN